MSGNTTTVDVQTLLEVIFEHDHKFACFIDLLAKRKLLSIYYPPQVLDFRIAELSEVRLKIFCCMITE